MQILKTQINQNLQVIILVFLKKKKEEEENQPFKNRRVRLREEAVEQRWNGRGWNGSGTTGVGGERKEKIEGKLGRRLCLWVKTYLYLRLYVSSQMSKLFVSGTTCVITNVQTTVASKYKTTLSHLSPLRLFLEYLYF